MVLKFNNLPEGIGKAELSALLRSYGIVKGMTRQNKTIYVRMRDTAEAKTVIHDLDGIRMQGQIIGVSLEANNSHIGSLTKLGSVKLF